MTQIIHFNRGFPWNKPSILGEKTLFLETPIGSTGTCWMPMEMFDYIILE